MGNIVLTTSSVPVAVAVPIENGNGTSLQTAFNGANQRAQVLEMYATNADVVDHVVDVSLVADGTPYLLGSANVPAGAGVAGAPTILLLTAIQGVGLQGVALDNYSNLAVNTEDVVTVAGNVIVVSLGQAF